MKGGMLTGRETRTATKAEFSWTRYQSAGGVKEYDIYPQKKERLYFLKSGEDWKGEKRENERKKIDEKMKKKRLSFNEFKVESRGKKSGN